VRRGLERSRRLGVQHRGAAHAAEGGLRLELIIGRETVERHDGAHLGREARQPDPTAIDEFQAGGARQRIAPRQRRIRRRRADLVGVGCESRGQRRLLRVVVAPIGQCEIGIVASFAHNALEEIEIGAVPAEEEIVAVRTLAPIAPERAHLGELLVGQVVDVGLEPPAGLVDHVALHHHVDAAAIGFDQRALLADEIADRAAHPERLLGGGRRRQELGQDSGRGKGGAALGEDAARERHWRGPGESTRWKLYLATPRYRQK